MKMFFVYRQLASAMILVSGLLFELFLLEWYCLDEIFSLVLIDEDVKCGG